MARAQQGLTLVEVLVTCVLVATLSGLALPAATRMLAAASAERTLHRLNAALAYARFVAVTEGDAVVLCPLDRDGRCDGDWSSGFAVFRDPERRARLTEGELPLRVFPGGGERVLLRAFRTQRYFRFLKNGQTDWQNGRFLVCPTRDGVSARSLVLNVQGRTRTVRDAVRPEACDENY